MSWIRLQPLSDLFPSLVPSPGGIGRSQGIGTGWPGAGKEGEGAAWHREAVWACVACVFQSLTLEETVAQSRNAQLLLESQRAEAEDNTRVSKELWEICEVGI